MASGWESESRRVQTPAPPAPFDPGSPQNSQKNYSLLGFKASLMMDLARSSNRKKIKMKIEPAFDNKIPHKLIFQ